MDFNKKVIQDILFFTPMLIHVVIIHTYFNYFVIDKCFGNFTLNFYLRYDIKLIIIINLLEKMGP